VANFESQLARLEQIVADLETGDLGLEEALGRFEAGVGLLRQCQATLTAAERQIELLTGIRGGGRSCTTRWKTCHPLALLSDLPFFQ
jgi:exodeoxyribonuclease VII small subunit